jgi:hypothetical protein
MHTSLSYSFYIPHPSWPHFNVISVSPSINLSIPRRRGSANVGTQLYIQQRSHCLCNPLDAEGEMRCAWVAYLMIHTLYPLLVFAASPSTAHFASFSLSGSLRQNRRDERTDMRPRFFPHLKIKYMYIVC